MQLDSLKFPTLTGVGKPSEVHKAYRVFYGLDFASKGIISVDPPEVNESYPILVPQVDADGNELAGVKMPEVSVPLATYTGWNLFNAESGPTNLLSSMQGSYIPLPEDARRSRAHERSPAVDRRALPKPRTLPLTCRRGCQGTGEAGLLARRGREHTRRTGRQPLEPRCRDRRDDRTVMRTIHFARTISPRLQYPSDSGILLGTLSLWS